MEKSSCLWTKMEVRTVQRKPKFKITQIVNKLCADDPNDTRENIALKLHGFIERLVQEGLLIP